MSVIQEEFTLTPRFNENDIKTLQTYFELNKKYYQKINEELTGQLRNHKLWAPIMASLSPEQLNAQNKHSLEIQHAAIYEGKWKEYSEDLIKQGKAYAQMNISYADWYEIVRMYKVLIVPYIKKDFVHAIDDAITFLDGLSMFTDYAMYIIAEAYFQEKNEIIKKTNQLFFNFFEYSPAAVSISHIDDRKITNVNSAFLSLYGFSTKRDVVDKTTSELNLLIHPEKVEEVINRLKRDKVVKNFETQIRTKENNVIWISISFVLIDVHSVPCIFSIAIDINEQKQAERRIIQLNEELEQKVAERTAELETTNKELESFSYSVSHDLRAPIRAINGYAKILEEDHTERFGPETLKYLVSIRKNSKKMGELIDDLLSFSKLGKKQLTTSSLDMNSIVNSVKEELLELEQADNIVLDIDMLPDAKGDRALIKQVWINLISNAIKYSKHRPKIIVSIGAYKKDNSIVYFINDNGAGFDMQYYDKLFGVFQRLHSQVEFEGTGIGLAIVQRILQRHGGTIWAESEIDKGAHFYFSLPN